MISLPLNCYPANRPEEEKDYYIGNGMVDPYGWLEDLQGRQTAEWLNRQNKLFAGYMSEIPAASLRASLTVRLESIWYQPKYSVIAREGNDYFYWGRDNMVGRRPQEQAILYRFDQSGGIPFAVLDPLELDSTGETVVSGQAFSPDGKLLAYNLSRCGSDRQQVRVRDLSTLNDYPEQLNDLKQPCIAWKPDKTGFYYNGYYPSQNLPGAIKGQGGLFWHALGTHQVEDRLVFQFNLEEHSVPLNFFPQVTDDGEYLVVEVFTGTGPTNQVYYQRITPGKIEVDCKPLLTADDTNYIFLGNYGSIFYFQTYRQAPHGKVIAVDILKPEPENWQTIVEESSNTLDFGLIANGRLVLVYLAQVHHLVRLYRLDGTFEKELDLPVTGTICGLTGSSQHTEFFLSLENYNSPAAVYRYSFEKEVLTPILQPPPARPAEGYETCQVNYPGLDGTLITLTLTHKKGLSPSGNQPTLLYGYGGFGNNLTPFYWVSQQIWLEQGGILAVANVRGGSENGREWHEAACQDKRQVAIDDFCQAARWLIEAGYTRPEKLAIMGASNGGLLVAASLVQQPNLFGAAICQVPLTDMLRYQHFGAGASWQAEFGNADNSPEEFAWLRAYSPLHNVRETLYPAILVATALHDERTHPMHAFKFTAALQDKNRGNQPILLRVDPKNGHGVYKPAPDLIAETADIYTFLFQSLNFGTF